MEGIHTLKSIVLEGNWLEKVDLKEAYFSVKNTWSFYVSSSRTSSTSSNVSPFTWPQPHGFLRKLRSSRSGVEDTDVCLHRQHSGRHQGEKQGSIVRSLYICYSTWASVNMEKMVLEPSQCIEFLGFTLDTTRMELSLPVQKTKKIWVESQQLLEVEQGTASTLPD